MIRAEKSARADPLMMSESVGNVPNAIIQIEKSARLDSPIMSEGI